jgi:hypothetical protein
MMMAAANPESRTGNLKARDGRRAIALRPSLPYLELESVFEAEIALYEVVPSRVNEIITSFGE